MSDERIKDALRGATDTEDVEISSGALSRVGEVFSKNFPGRAAVIVADENTFGVAGEGTRDSLEEAGVELREPYVFPGTPTLYAKYSNIEKLVEALRGTDAVPVAVGSGTLNDIAKRAAHELGEPYMCVGTAASMDGYTAFGASIEKDGHKQTLTCPAPKVVVGDVDVLVGAPEDMTAAGYADLLGKITSGADWLVADALEVEEIDPDGWSLVQDGLREWVENPEGLAAGDPEAMDLLTEGLVMSGLSMQSYQSSRTASGAEHQFSHLWEGEGLGRDRNPPLSHGFKVGVGSIAVAALFERVLERDLSSLDVGAAVGKWPSWDEVEAHVRSVHTIDELEEAAVKQSGAKYLNADELRERLELLKRVWPELSGKLREHSLSAGELRGMLVDAGCPVSPEEIGLGRDEFRATYRRALTIRSRYTVLDLSNEAGILDGCVDELFAPGGFWAT
ncbi:MAG: sn-glycerol-1-phosphate dehydrogenase [Actinomycetota bacterium]|nr:sn-glycerol-1-phosphate dehydrogenase [Actinomycetota bacterium]